MNIRPPKVTGRRIIMNVAKAFLVKQYGTKSLAETLAEGESAALSLDFTDDYFHSGTGFYGSAYIVDPTTPANNYDSHPYGLLSYTSPSNKLLRKSDGYFRFAAHNMLTSSELLGATGSTGWTVNRTTMTAGLQQYDEDGNLLPLMQRTWAAYVFGLTEVQAIDPESNFPYEATVLDGDIQYGDPINLKSPANERQ